MGVLRIGGTLLLVALWAGPARAQGPLAEAEEQLAAADFQGALRSLQEAERVGPLTREQLVQLYARRAIVHLALGNVERMDADLRRLATLDPGHAFGPEARPELTEGFARIGAMQREPLTVAVTTSQQPGALRVEATVSGDTAELTRSVRVAARRAGGRWEVDEDGTLLLPVTAGTVEYYAEVVGPAGAILAREGSEAAPRSTGMTGAHDGSAPGASTPLDGDGEAERGGAALGLWLAGGALLVAAVVGVVLLVALSGNDATQPGAPVIYE